MLQVEGMAVQAARTGCRQLSVLHTYTIRYRYVAASPLHAKDDYLAACDCRSAGRHVGACCVCAHTAMRMYAYIP